MILPVNPRLVERLDRWVRGIESWPVLPRSGAHYVSEPDRR